MNRQVALTSPQLRWIAASPSIGRCWRSSPSPDLLVYPTSVTLLTVYVTLRLLYSPNCNLSSYTNIGLLLTGVSVRSAKTTGEYNMLAVWRSTLQGCAPRVFFVTLPRLPILNEGSSATQGNLALNAVTDAEWRGELNQRVQAYRQRRRRVRRS